MSRAILFASLLLTASAAVAQIPDRLVGLTRIASDLRTLDPAACALTNSCAPAGFPSGAGMPWYAGGTAWDPVHSGAWISNGSFVACVDDACNYLCQPFQVALPPGVVITGLEVVESRNQLWAVDSADVLHVLTLDCPPQPVNTCPVQFLQANLTTTGLAVDELNGFVFFARTDPATGQNVVAYSAINAPCAVLQGMVVLPCVVPVGALTGLACDSAARAVYCTDGTRLVRLEYSLAAPGVLLPWAVTCCQPPALAADPLVGLALRPAPAVATGVVCANGACPACPMTHGLLGDPVLGNGQFGYHLGGAPSGSMAWCFVGAGPCNVPGIAVPPLCGPVFTQPLLGTLGVAFVGGPGGCGGAVDFPMALPANAGLAGVVLSSQCAVLCAGPAGFGTSLSRGLSFVLQGL